MSFFVSNYSFNNFDLEKIAFFMTKSGLPKSLRKFIRKEKARIRRQVLDLGEQEKLISDLYKKLIKQKNEN